MSLNPKYITAPSLQSYFTDKDTGEPLSGGKIFFYRDSVRTEPKAVYEIQGNAANYTYSPLPNPVILSAVGTIADNNGNDVIPYYYPYDADGEQDLYYIVVQNSLGVPQFTRPAWPNPGAGGGSNANDVVNYVPNGQFLAHNNLEDDLLVAGSNSIAQGGWSIELDDPALSPASVNTLTFITEAYTQDPPQSPRFTANFVCTSPNDLETTKILRLKFRDVNKFTDQNPFTYAFWMQSTFAVPFSVSVYRDFGTGGSTAVTSDTQLGTSTTTGTYFNFEINFGSNAGYNIGSANDDFIAIDIAFPTDIAFNVQFTDAVLSNQTEEVIVSFPVQTDASMLTNSLNGWVTTPDPDGMDLYLPQILTKEGMIWDDSQIGEVGFSLFPLASPDALPAAQDNKMLANGATYITADRSANGIPYRRLFNYLISFSNQQLPVYGTGDNYVSALGFSASANFLRVTYNLAGTSSINAAQGGVSTGFSFSNMYIYNGVATGTANYGYFASNVTNDVSPQILAVLNAGSWLINPGAGTSGFTVTSLATDTSIRAFQQQCFYVLAVAGSTLVTGGAAKYFIFSSASVSYYMWFQTGTESDPAVGGRTGIQVNIESTFTAQDVANVIREALNGFLSTFINMPSVNGITGTALPPNNSYLTFSSNPASARNFIVWFNVDGTGVQPIVPSVTAIECALTTGMTTTQLRNALRLAINSYQYQAPDLEGVFYRGVDPDAKFDLDNAYRWSYVPGVSGSNAGTYESQQFLSHFHQQETTTVLGTGAAAQYTIGATGTVGGTTQSAGGSETRPVNVYVCPFIRY